MREFMPTPSRLPWRLSSVVAILFLMSCATEFDVNESPSPFAGPAFGPSELVAAVSRGLGRIEGYSVDSGGNYAMSPTITGTPVSVRLLAAYSYVGEVSKDTMTVALVWLKFNGRTILKPENRPNAQRDRAGDTIVGNQWAFMVLERSAHVKWISHVSMHLSDRIPMSLAFNRSPSLEDAYRFASVWTEARAHLYLVGDSLPGLVVPKVSSHRRSGPEISWSAVDSLAWTSAFGRAPVVRYVE